ncbi:hypothetical protein PAMP_020360 [Pampus punctatissimus]
MSNRLAFQTQLASIMEVLANAAVAEICKLVDDDYAVVSLQMSQCQRENKALKRKLHLLELKMARGNAERRLRESALSSSRPRVQINSDRLREPSPAPGGVFEQQLDVALWSGRAAAGDTASKPIHSDSVQSKSPDVELVEPEELLVKEEKVEANMSQHEEMEDVPLIGDDVCALNRYSFGHLRTFEATVGYHWDSGATSNHAGVVECVPHGVAGQRPTHEQQDTQSQPRSQSRSQSSRTRRIGSRGVEVSGSSPLLKCELSASLEDQDSLQETINSHQYIDEGSNDSQFDVLCCDKSAKSLVEEFFDETSLADVEGRKLPCSYSMAADDFPSTSSSINGWARYSPGFPPSQPFSDGSKACHRAGTKERLFTEEEPDVVLVKVEEMESVTGAQSESGLSIQEGLVESSTDDYRGVLTFDETTQNSTNQLSDLQESGRGFSESAAPQLTRRISEDSSSITTVQLRVPDTNTQQQQRSSNSNPLSSEYSLFELETFFTRWAPDNDSALAPAAPSCSFTTDDSAGCDQNGVIIIDAPPQPQHVLQPPQDQAFSAMRSGGHSSQSLSSASSRTRVHIQPTVSQALPAATSVSIPLETQAPSSQLPWSRTPAMIRSAQAQLLHHNSNKISQQQPSNIHSVQVPLSTTITAASDTNSADKTGIPSISSTSRTMTSTVAPHSALSVRGSTAALANIDVAIAAHRRASLANHHNKNQAPSMVPCDRRRKSYICRACGKAFSGLSNLEAHKRVHTGEKPFHCNTCGKCFSEAGNLKKHQRVHTGEKPFSCDHCGKRFAWICNLRTHQQSATGCGQQSRGGLGLG